MNAPLPFRRHEVETAALLPHEVRYLGGHGGAFTDLEPDTLRAHLRRVGPRPRPDAVDLIVELERIALTGRGGGHFPTARKWRAARDATAPLTVVANGAEGEPLSMKDKVLCSTAPHLVLDGAVVAAAAIGATEVIVVVDRSASGARAAVTNAIEERRAARLDDVSFRTVDSPTRFLAGEESALVHWLNGGPAKPTLVPPRPFERGVGGRPTLVQNVETLAHVALIARFGESWFRALGDPTEPGSALVTVAGAVARPGVLEISLGAPVTTVIEAAGGVTEKLSAFLVGGYFGTWVRASEGWNLALSNERARAAGAAFGCGLLVALPATACGVLETAAVMQYLAQETAGQCGPCVHGLKAIAHAMVSIAHGDHDRGTVERLHRWGGDVAGRGACHYPDGAVRFVASALDVFGDEVARHGQNRGCTLERRARVLSFPNRVHREWGWR